MSNFDQTETEAELEAELDRKIALIGKLRDTVIAMNAEIEFIVFANDDEERRKHMDELKRLRAVTDELVRQFPV